MYENFYQLSADPFRLSPDPRFCYRHQSYAKASAYMQYALHRAEGFVMITGGPGTGKTTLSQDLLADLDSERLVVTRLTSTQLRADDLVRALALGFAIPAAQELDKATALRRIEDFLVAEHRAGRRTVVVVDDAHELFSCALKELRLLGNLQLDNQLLLQVVLLGEEALRERVRAPGMAQLHQRIIASCHLRPLEPEETNAYVRHRLTQAGWHNDPQIDDGAYALIHRFSRGVPRRINLVCSRLLLYGSLEERHRLTVADAELVLAGLDEEALTPSAETQSAMAPPTAPPEPAAPPAREPPVPDVRSLADLVVTQSAARQPAQSSHWSHPAALAAGAFVVTLAGLLLAVGAPQFTAQPGPVNQPRAALSNRAAVDVAARTESLAASASSPELTQRPLHRSEARKSSANSQATRASSPQTGTEAQSPPHQGGSKREGAEATTWSGPRVPSATEVPPTEQGPARGDGVTRGTATETPAPRAGRSLRQALERVFAAGRASTATLPGGIIRVEFSGDLSFEFNSEELEPALRSGLTTLAEVLRAHRQTTLTVVGHTDDVGAEALNWELSQRRADAVANYLEAQGISGQRLRTEGRGATEPRAANDSNLSRRLNRRVEIYIAPRAREPQRAPVQRNLVVPLLSRLGAST